MTDVGMPSADETPNRTSSAKSTGTGGVRALRRPVGMVCCAYLFGLILVAVFAPIFLPKISGQQAGDILAARQAPTGNHLLGTDTLGRDVLARLLVGTRPTLVGVAEALIVVLALGVPFGLIAGYVGGWFDRLVGWLADITFSMPVIVIVLVVLAVFPQNMAAAMVTLGVIAAPGLIRIVRSATLPVREEPYIAAAKVSGLSRSYIIARHVFPRISGVIIVQASLLAGVALLVQTGLAFLNLVVAAPAPSWGGMVADGSHAIVLQPWLIWPPGIAIGLTILALGLLGDAVRDASVERWSAPAVRSKGAWRLRGASPIVPSEAIGKRLGAVVSLENLQVDFVGPNGVTTVVRGVDISVRPGETLGLVGESGCGKTTVAMSIIGLLSGSGRISSGHIWFDGQDLAMLSERQLRRVRGKEIGFVSQDPMIGLTPVLRVGGQLAEAIRRHQHVSAKVAHLRAIELLRRVRLPDPERVAHSYPHELSGGMAQRVAIARALAGEPKLLIADEPTTALDVTVQAGILGLFRELQTETGMAILLVTHDWGVVADLCDRTVVMYAGEVVEVGEVRSLFGQPMHPYTAALLAANPHNSTDEQLLPVIPGGVPAPGNWPTGCHFHPRCQLATSLCSTEAIALEPIGDDRLTRCIHYDEMTRTSAIAAQ